MIPTFFSSQEKFREWLDKNHEVKSELLVGFFTVGSKKASMTWPESVDQALCYGWIDGIRRNIDAESYSIRFTPRKPKSIWSAVNVAKVESLISKGLMQPAGMTAYSKRAENRTGVYSFENEPKELTPSFIERFMENKKGWEFFNNLAPSYQRTAIYWVMSAKQESTKVSRLDKLIQESTNGNRVR